MLRSRLALVLVVPACSTVALTTPASAAPGDTTLVSVSSAEVPANRDSGPSDVSADGRFVAFQSTATNLDAADTDADWDVYVRDLATDTTELISRNVIGLGNDGTSWTPSISADGRFVAFSSKSNRLVAGDVSGSVFDVFRHDRLTGLTTLVTGTLGGADGDSYGENISADGRFITFGSRATNLVAGDTNGFQDIFVYDAATGLTTRTTATDGEQADNHSLTSDISADGRFVAFASLASNLVSGDTNVRTDIFVQDRDSGGITKITRGADGGEADGSSFDPRISDDGRYVAFYAEASNLTADSPNSSRRVYWHDRSTGRTRIASRGVNGPSSGGDYISDMSGDGRYVVFYSFDNGLTPDDDSSDYDVYVRDLQRATTDMVTVDSAGQPVDAGGTVGQISNDGSLVAFGTYSANLTSPPFTEYGSRVYVHERVAPADPPTPVSIDQAPAQVSSDPTPAFEFSSPESGATFECSLVSAGDAADYAPCTSPTAYGAQPDGDYVFAVQASDEAGNQGQPVSFSFTIDTASPSVTINDGPGVQTTDDTPTFAFSAEPGATFECRISLGVHPFAPCTSPVTYGPLPEGTYTFAVRATDAAGNLGPTLTYTFTIDTVDPVPAPSTPDLVASSDTGTSNTDNVTSDTTPTFTGTAPADTTVTILVDGVARGSGPAPGGTFTITSSTLAIGTRSVTAVASAPGGATSEPSGALTIQITSPTACETATNTLTGTNASNTLNGGRLADRILGLGGNDILDGKANNDCVVGGTGNDQMRGGVGNDELVGEDGADTLTLGDGVDLASGGAGNDRITSRDTVADRVDCGAGTDTVIADNLDTVVNCETVRRN